MRTLKPALERPRRSWTLPITLLTSVIIALGALGVRAAHHRVDLVGVIQDVNSSIVQVVTSSPNGVVTAAKGTLAIETTTPTIWQNTDGGTTWVQFISGSDTQESVYYGPGTDGTVTFDGTTTILGIVPSSSTYVLTKDIAPQNMTVNNGVTIRTDNFRVFVKGTLTNNGTIMSNGFTAVNQTHGNGGGNNTHFYAASLGNGGNGGAAGAGGVGNGPGTAPTQWVALGTTAAGANGGGFGQGGGGGSTGANAGGGGAAVALGSTNGGVFTAVGGFTGKGDAIGVSWTLTGSGGGGGGCVGGACTGGGGGGGGGPVFVGANQCLGTGVISSKGGNGGTAVLGGGTGAGGGGGGGGGVVVFIYSHRSAGCTTSVAGGTGTVGVGTGANGGNGSSGLALTLNLSGDGT